MAVAVDETKELLAEYTTDALKTKVEKDAWIALRQYFRGTGNGPEAKVACVVLGTLARERQAKNNARQLTLLERRFSPEVSTGSGDQQQSAITDATERPLVNEVGNVQ